MASDDKYFFDVLAEYSKDIRKFTGGMADAADKHFESVAAHIKERLSNAEWLPQVARPSRPTPPPLRATCTASLGYVGTAQDWISRNKAISAAIVAFVGTGAFMIWRQKKGYARKRRARRASNGARREVVVIAGPVGSPITISIARDLERRGFIVYIIVSTAEEEQEVKSEARVDIRPLHLDVVDSLSTRESIERFNNLLLSPHLAFSGASPHNLNFRGLLLIPDQIYPSGPVETISPELWSDALNAKVLNTIATAQAFLPTICDFKARVLVLTPSIVSSLRPPFHGVESAVVGALEGFTSTLRGELATLGINVCQFKLGTFSYSSVGGKQHLQSLAGPKTTFWPASTQASYAQNYITQSRIAGDRGIFDFNESGNASSGSSLRELHNAVFDALTQKHPRSVWKVGRGSFAYDFVGSWLPAGLVGWMLGIRRVSLSSTAEPKLEDSVQSWEKVDAIV